jgi:uncharacterized membrane protein
MKRLNNIDFTRGLIMLIMAIDHTRDLLHITSLSQDPTNLTNTTPALFLTRWITHLCAPTFVFLSGTSVWLSMRNQGNLNSSRRFLARRGLWLIILEFTIVNFGIWFDIHFRILMLQVIGAIGGGFVILSLLLKLPPKTIGIIGLVIVFGHNLIPPVSFQNPALTFVWSIFFQPNFFQISPNFSFLINYPIIPWLGIMLTGFACGQLFDLPDTRRKKLLLQIGLAALGLFVILRFINIYGDPAPWKSQKDFVFTLLSFINVTKYPPSLLYTLVTLGISFLVLSFSDGVQNQFTKIVSVYGKVPLFYYLIHWYLIHSLMLILVLSQGYSFKDLSFQPFAFGRPPGFGFELGYIYLIWFAIILSLYPLCLWYSRYKASHRENVLLRYL